MNLSRCVRWTNKLISSLISSPANDNSLDSRQELNRLETMMQRIQALIRDYENQISSSMSEVDKCRLEDLKDVAFSADDVLDEYMYQVLRARIEAQCRVAGQKRKRPEEEKKDVFDSLPIPAMIPASEELYNKAVETVKGFNKLTTEWEALSLWESDGERRGGIHATEIEETSSFLIGIHGREHDKEKVIDMFNENISRASAVSVLCINGMAGIGKTTLAQMVYNDTRVVSSFNLRGWVWVGGDFDVKTVLNKIIQSFTNSNIESKELNALQKKLHEEVKGKTFFLVLDDVWNDTTMLWDKLLAPLVNALSGIIVVTSRDISVANIRQAMDPYPLRDLPTNDCWSLFEQMVFEGKEQNKRPELIAIGHDIVKKCKGLPMAVKALGAALRGKTNADDWYEILNSRLWDSGERGCDGFPAMKLSYDRMPLLLKQCFIFFSLFPKAYVFLKDDIVRLWMSLGLLKHEGTKPMEDVGNGLVEDLLRWSMIQKAPNDEAKEGFTMHDLVHNLAEEVAGKDFKRMEDNDLFNVMKLDMLKSISRVRYLSIIIMQSSGNIIGLHPLLGSRTWRLLQFVDQRNTWNNCGFNINIPNGVFKCQKHLRALDFSNTAITTLPDSIINLIHLRYLALTNTGIEELPESICRLYNLETLELKGCPIQQLPQGIKNLVKLRHLNFERWFYMCMPRGIGQLTSLRTLSWFDVGSASWHCEISELRGLVNLGGEICIGGLNNVVCAKEAKEADLRNKRNIAVLRLDWSSKSEKCEHDTDSNYITEGPSSEPLDCVDPKKIHYQVIESLQPHDGLEELHIDSYCGSKYPNWLVADSFTKLVKVSLVGDKEGCELLPALGQLPSLENLSIKSMFSVKRIGREFYSSGVPISGVPIKRFQKLKTLEFVDMVEWSEWSQVENGELCSLRTLRIIDCPKLSSLPQPLSSSLRKLVVKDCDMLTRFPILPSLSCLILKGRLNEEIFCNLNLPSLRILKVCNSSNIKTMGFSYQTLLLLEVVVIHGCESLLSVVGFSGLMSLKLFKIQQCPKVQLSHTERIPGMLQHLQISDCPKLKDWELVQWKTLQDQHNDGGANDEVLQLLAEPSLADSDADVMQ